LLKYNTPKIKSQEDLDLNDKEVRKELGEMALGQLANLSWQQGQWES
jgi:hypothetical protein